MPTRTPAGVVLADFKAKASERALPITLSDGSTVQALPPELWPDEVQACLIANDVAGAAALIVGGEEEYARFKADGGNSSLLMSMLEETLGTSVGKSSASSRS